MIADHVLDANFPTGSRGLIVVAKTGNRALFLDPQSYEIVHEIGGFPWRIHELAISPDHMRALCPVYGDGMHGNNPNPGNQISIIDLETRCYVGDFALGPYVAPHGLRWGPRGQLYCNCENSGVILEMDGETGDHVAAIEVGSTNAHRIEVLPDGSKLYTENEEDASASVVDLHTRKLVKKIATPNGLAGIGLSPDGRRIVLVDDVEPQLLLVDTTTDEITRRVALEGHRKGAQIARYSPDGRHCVVTSYPDPLATIFDGDLSNGRLVRIGQGPMNMAFHPDGRTVLIANQDEGSISVVDMQAAIVVQTVEAGVGPETLAFF